MSKRRRIAELARARRLDSLPPHRGFSEFHGGIYDQHDHVVPWTISAHRVNSPVMIIGQDWNSADNLGRPVVDEQVALGQIPWLPSNINLQARLAQHFGMNFGDTYATDLFVFAKPGNMTARIPSNHLRYCACRYAVPQIEIIRPRIAVCLGVSTYNAIRTHLTRRPRVRLRDALQEDEPLLIGKTNVVVVPHTGAWGKRIANAGEYWERAAEFLR
ncbi:uracil-DNA glycosylase family protein [Mesorhizobium sp. B3-2-1]|uniref:uracil-DNA glycosylase family protein n=1 Tax=Mesorhizobium sp. B3-2-1 TaxID=2589891 RepID=UPI0015E3FC7E|nr:uracil-DNA glycosylase family protein [Mesorhizobium sp. B3-2-1]